MSISYHQEIQKRLNPGEKIVWIGHPNPLSYAISSINPLYKIFIVLSLPIPLITLISILSEPAKLFDTSDSNIQIATIVMLVYLLYLLKPLFNYFIAKKTSFVITNKRAFKLNCWILRFITKNFTPDKINNIKIEKNRYSYNLYFFTDDFRFQYGGIVTLKYGFNGIKNREELEKAFSYTQKLKTSSL